MNIPEIVYRIGWFVEVKTPPRGYEWDPYNPADLIALTKVNRLCHITLMPLLWMVYDKDWMVAFATVQAQSHHFRYLTLERWHGDRIWRTPQEAWPANGLRSTHLRGLRIDYKMLLDNMNLLYSNPQLSVLVLQLLSSGIDDNLDCIQQGLESLTRLKTLYLEFPPSYITHRLATVLNNNAAALTSLIIDTPRCTLVFDGCQPLVTLTHVDLAIGCNYDRQLPQLFRNCPSLTRLRLIHMGVCPVTELSKTMREFCPNLESIQYWSEAKNDHPWIVCNAVTMLQASGRWLHVDTYIYFISAEFCKTLISHAGWLETLVLYYMGLGKDLEVSGRNVSMILAHCNHLRTVRVIGRSCHRSLDAWLGWFKEEGPWACSNLEVFVFKGFAAGEFEFQTKGEKSVDGLVRPTLFHSSKDKAFLEAIASQGWSYEPHGKTCDGGRAATATTLAFREMVFGRLGGLPQMKHIQVEIFEYVRKDMMTRQEHERFLNWYQDGARKSAFCCL